LDQQLDALTAGCRPEAGLQRQAVGNLDAWAAARLAALLDYARPYSTKHDGLDPFYPKGVATIVPAHSLTTGLATPRGLQVE
jgi:hypothetical protein